MKKLNLKIPAVSDNGIDVFLIIMGVGVIAYALYISGVFNGPGKVIDASNRFGKPNQDARNTPSGDGATE